MKVKQAKQIANKAIEELVATLNANPSEALTSYLKTVAKFHKYSFNNILLIAMACPQATHVAGFHTWRTLGRHVKRGAKGIRIFAPVSRRRVQQADAQINEEILSGDSTSVFGFRAVYVFDESMTEGKPLAELNSVQGDPSDYRARLEQFIQQQGIALEYSADIAPARGTSQGGKITILPGQSPAETVETLAHEIAHELQQLRPGCRPVRLRRSVLGQAGPPMSTDVAFTPRSLTASEYVRELFEPADNAAILVRNRSTGHTVQRIAKAEAIASADFQTWLTSQSAGGSDVFIGMNPIKDATYNRTKENIKDIRHLYLDLDRKGDEALEAIRNSSEVPAPNFVLDTSPGKHQIVWKVSGFSQDEAESLLRNLANKFDGDLAATDSTRVLRLPGFANRKLSEEFIVQARQESDAVYTLRDFTIEEASPETQPHLTDYRGTGRKVASAQKSQSEHDWAYAKRALARGDDPEVVIERIADYRAADKDDPRYYARRTVTKAQADLHRGTATVGTKDSQRIENDQLNEAHREMP